MIQPVLPKQTLTLASMPRASGQHDVDFVTVMAKSDFNLPEPDVGTHQAAADDLSATLPAQDSFLPAQRHPDPAENPSPQPNSPNTIGPVPASGQNGPNGTNSTTSVSQKGLPSAQNSLSAATSLQNYTLDESSFPAGIHPAQRPTLSDLPSSGASVATARDLTRPEPRTVNQAESPMVLSMAAMAFADLSADLHADHIQPPQIANKPKVGHPAFLHNDAQTTGEPPVADPSQFENSAVLVSFFDKGPVQNTEWLHTTVPVPSGSATQTQPPVLATQGGAPAGLMIAPIPPDVPTSPLVIAGSEAQLIKDSRHHFTEMRVDGAAPTTERSSEGLLDLPRSGSNIAEFGINMSELAEIQHETQKASQPLPAGLPLNGGNRLAMGAGVATLPLDHSAASTLSAVPLQQFPLGQPATDTRLLALAPMTDEVPDRQPIPSNSAHPTFPKGSDGVIPVDDAMTNKPDFLKNSAEFRGDAVRPALDSQPLVAVMVDGGHFQLPDDAAPAHPRAPVTALAADVLRLVQTAPNGPVTLTLRPEELGTLRFEMTQTDHGLHIHLAVEQPQTLDFIRRQGDQLLADLRQAGFASATFSFSGGGAQDAPPQQEETPRDAARLPNSPVAHDFRSLHQRPSLPLGTLDLRL